MIKKTTILLISFFCAASAYAVTDQKTIDFLETVNSQYYCLSRLGLKNFTADVSFTTVRISEAELKEPLSDYLDELDTLSFAVSITNDGKIDVTFTPTSAIRGDRDSDKRALEFGQNLAKGLEGYLKQWTFYVMEPLFHNYGYDKNFTIQNTAEGFTVLRKDKVGTADIDFDHQSKGLSLREWSAGNSIVTHYGFSKTDRGYLMNEIAWVNRTTQVSAKYEYQTVGNYLLPQKIRSHVDGIRFIVNGIEYYFTFSNYKINQ